MSGYDNPATTDPDTIKVDIEQTRAELVDDVDTLSGKVSPRARARQALATARSRAAGAPAKAGQAARSKGTPVAAVGLLAVVAAVVAVRRAKTPAPRSRWEKLTRR
jgi:hypothetical protein